MFLWVELFLPNHSHKYSGKSCLKKFSRFLITSQSRNSFKENCIEDETNSRKFYRVFTAWKGPECWKLWTRKTQNARFKNCKNSIYKILQISYSLERLWTYVSILKLKNKEIKLHFQYNNLKQYWNIERTFPSFFSQDPLVF